MSFASDIKAKTVVASGDAVNGRTRVQGVYFTNSATASSFTLKTGGSSGTTILDMKTPAAAGSSDLMISDNGILATDGVYVTFENSEVKSVTVLYVGGAPA
jgi:hypothetical protein